MAQTKVRSKQQIEVNSNVDFAGYKLINLGTPTNANDAVTKAYADSIKQSLDVKDSCRVATVGTETYTISGGTVTDIAGNTIDGISVVIGDRVLVKNAPSSTGAGIPTGTAQPANGIYRVVSVGTSSISLTRSDDADVSSEVTGGMFTFVTEGTANQDNGYVLTTNDTIVLNTTPLAFVQFSGAGQINAGNGIEKNANTLSVKLDGDTLSLSSAGVRLNTVTPTPSTATQIRKFEYDSYGRISAQANATFNDIKTTIGIIAPANRVFATSATTGNEIPDFRALVANDIPALPANKITSGILAVAQGGTGFGLGNPYVAGDLLVATGATTMGIIRSTQLGRVLVSQGGEQSPVWGQVNLDGGSKHVTGILYPINGGIGSSVLPSNGMIPIGTSANNTYVPTLPQSGTGIKITAGAGSLLFEIDSTTIIAKSDYIVREIPTGTINGVNASFTLAQTPSLDKEMVFVNGILMNKGATNDYTISGKIITFNTDAIPQTNDVVLVTYVK